MPNEERNTMKQPQPHSPGPWTVKRNDLGQFIIVDARGCVIAEIDGPYTPSFDRYEADAALIAGAPGLSEACRLAVAFLDDATHDAAADFTADEVLAVLRNAIERTVVYEDDGE